MKNILVTPNKDRLGRGLDALLGPPKEEPHNLLLDIEKIHPGPHQPRRLFNKDSLKELSASIKKNGLLQPILVQKQGDNFYIIAGERRWRASCMAGLKKIPAIIKAPRPHQKALWALIENIQREDLNPIDLAKAFKQLMEEEGLSQELLAQSLGRSRSSVANFLRLLSLDKEVQALVSERKISFAQARELLRFKSPREQKAMAQACIKKSLTVKGLNRWALRTKKPESLPFWAKKALSHLERRFSQKLSLNYFKGKGRLSFAFKNEEELKNLLNRLWDK